MGERLVFDIFANTDASGFAKAGDAAGVASDKILGLARRLDEVSKKTATARVGLAGDKEAQAALDKIDVKLLAVGKVVSNPKISVTGAARATADISALDIQLDKLDAKSAAAEVSAGAAGLGGPSGLGALLGAGAALSPVLLTLGAGTGGFAAAAAGVLGPVTKAAEKTGGLQKNMSKLNPVQQTVARSLLGLGKEYHAFEQSLQPEVISAVNDAIKIGGNVMHDVQPVAAATGKAFDSFLGEFGATLQDPEWKSFWQFMATTAPQDMQMVSKLVIDLTNDLPGLMRGLQPVGEALLKVTDAAAAGIQRIEQPPKGSTLGVLEKFFSSGQFPLTASMKAAAEKAQLLSTGFDHNATQANAMGIKLIAAETDVKRLMDAQSAALAKQTAYAGDLVTTANDAASLRAALKASGDQIGTHTQKQRDSFSAANAYINDLSATATQAHASGKGVDAAIRAISNGLPILDAAKSKNRAYWQEVATLKGWLDKLRAEKAITEVIHITGTSSFAGTAGVLPGQPGKHFVGQGGAAGMLVTGGVPGRDSVPILAMPGEAVVPKHLTPALAPFLAAHGVPGFASGGLIGGPLGSTYLDVSARGDVLKYLRQIAESTHSTALSSSALHARISAERSYESQVRQGLGGYASLSAVSSGHGMSIESQLRGRLGNLKDFAHILRQLAAEHAPASIMRQIVALGPADGIAYGKEILGGGHALMKQLSATEAGISSTETKIARGVASYSYSGQFRTGRDYIHIENLHITLPHGSTREEGRRIVEAIKKFEKGSGKSWRS